MLYEVIKYFFNIIEEIRLVILEYLLEHCDTVLALFLPSIYINYI